MALLSVRRWSWVPLAAAVGLVQGCGSKSVDDGGSSSGCSKDSDCRAGRICENKVCVADPNAGAVLGGSSGTSSGTGGATAGTSTGTQGGTGNASNGGTGNASNGGSGPKGGSGGASGSAGTGGAQGGTSGTAGSSGTGGTCSEDDPATCPTTDSMTFCSQGALVTYSCSDYCGALGFPTGPCAAPDGCACDFNNPTDQTCVIATNALCGCLMGTTTPCVTMLDPSNPDSAYYYPPFIYAACHGGDPADMQFLHCIADQAQMTTAPTCADAINACDPSGGQAGAAGAPSQ